MTPSPWPDDPQHLRLKPPTRIAVASPCLPLPALATHGKVHASSMSLPVAFPSPLPLHSQWLPSPRCHCLCYGCLLQSSIAPTRPPPAAPLCRAASSSRWLRPRTVRPLVAVGRASVAPVAPSLAAICRGGLSSLPTGSSVIPRLLRGRRRRKLLCRRGLRVLWPDVALSVPPSPDLAVGQIHLWGGRIRRAFAPLATDLHSRYTTLRPPALRTKPHQVLFPVTVFLVGRSIKPAITQLQARALGGFSFNTLKAKSPSFYFFNHA